MFLVNFSDKEKQTKGESHALRTRESSKIGRRVGKHDERSYHDQNKIYSRPSDTQS